jgi:hypothetical protein
MSAQGINTFSSSCWKNMFPTPQVHKPPTIAKQPVAKNNMPNSLFILTVFCVIVRC